MNIFLLFLLSGLPFIGLGFIVMAIFSKVINKPLHARILGGIGTILTLLGIIVWAKHDVVIAHLAARGHL